MKVSCDFRIEKETEKAVYAEVKTGECLNTTKYMWLPKSACEIQEFVQTVNALGEPETYGKRVVRIEEWLARKIKIGLFMTIKELFDKNKGRIIKEFHKGIIREFSIYEDYITYLNNYFGDKVVIAIINGELKKHSENPYSLDVAVKMEIPKICIYDGFWWDVERLKI